MTVSQDLATNILKATGYKGESDRSRALEVMIWAEALHSDVTLQDALRAIAEHRGTVGGYIEPVHINRLTARYRRERVNLDLIQIPVPDGLADEPRLEVQWRAAWLTAVKAGESETTATASAWAAIGKEPPREIEASTAVDARARLEKFKTAFGRTKKGNQK